MFTAIRSFLNNLLYELGFISKSCTILLLGLDNAGKTTLQYKLKTGKLQQFLPTSRAREELIELGNLSLRSIDLGGHTAARYLWRKYSAMADGIIFIIDSADKSRFNEAKLELHSLLATAAKQHSRNNNTATINNDSTESTDIDTDPDIDNNLFNDFPVAILANKQDLSTAINCNELSNILGLSELGHVDIAIFPISIVNSTGYIEAFNWLAKRIP